MNDFGIQRLVPRFQQYNPEKGIRLKHSGLTFVRAVAVSRGRLDSNVMTSRRFWVLTATEEVDSSEAEEEQVDGNKAVNIH